MCGIRWLELRTQIRKFENHIYTQADTHIFGKEEENKRCEHRNQQQETPLPCGLRNPS